MSTTRTRPVPSPVPGPPPPPTRSGLRAVVALGVAAVLAAVVGYGLWSARPTSHGSTGSSAKAAPTFTLPSTSGGRVALAGLRGKNVLLYFNEGVGCDACFYQTVEIEKNLAQLTRRGVTLLPVVMNPAEQTRGELRRFGLRTPYLIDADGAVSKAYGALGKGMHAGLPGHSFVLVDRSGKQRWYGEYPTMYLPSKDLLRQIDEHLT